MDAPLLVKICGITRAEDAQVARDAGADCFGMLYEFPVSKRSLTFARVEQIVHQVDHPFVLVTVNLDPDRIVEAQGRVNPFALQLHGDETPDSVRDVKSRSQCQIWKVIHVDPGELPEETIGRLVVDAQSYHEAGCDALMIDTRLPFATDERRYGGTGTSSDWKSIREIADASKVPIILLGGLRPENVRSAIQIVGPYGVDVSSGVEISPGIKDADRIRSFVSEARAADTSHTAH